MDPYRVLGISKSSSNDEIRRHYLKLARQYHPDKNDENDVRMFQEIEYAYTLITGNIRSTGTTYKPQKTEVKKPKAEPKAEPQPKPEHKPKPTPKPEPPPQPKPEPKKPEPKFRKNQSLDSFLKQQINDFYKKNPVKSTGYHF